MKDPLQMKETPYEILGIPEVSDKDAIEAAYKSLFANRKDLPKRTNARRVLLEPAQRMQMDCFLYDDAFLSQLGFPSVNASYILTEKRLDTSKLWEKSAVNYFPDYSSLHSLAVLWYWWALFLEDEQIALHSGEPAGTAVNLQGGVSLDEAWNNAMAYWVLLINSNDFWKDWCSTKYNMEPLSVQEEIEKNFLTTLSNYAEKYGNIGKDESAKRLRNYEVVFSTEMSAAKTFRVNNIAITVNGVICPVCCGKLLLEKLDMLGAVHLELEKAIKGNPNNEKLKAALMGLSEFSNIATLLQNKKYDEVISSINALPQQKQKKEEVLKMLSAAYHERGKQCFSSGQYKDAFDFWSKGLKTGHLEADIKKTIISSCTSKAGSLTGTKPEVVIELLELALKSIDDKGLKDLLGDLLVQRAIKLINDAQKAAEGQIPADQKKQTVKNAVTEVENGIKLLKRAAELGCKRADENIKAAQNILEYIKSGVMELNAEQSEAFRRAEEAAGRNDFDTAVAILDKFCTSADAPGFLKQQLAHYLNFRAVKSINTVMDKANASSGKNMPVDLDTALSIVMSKSDKSKPYSWGIIIPIAAFSIIGLISSIQKHSSLGIFLSVVGLVITVILMIAKLVYYSTQTAFVFDRYGRPPCGVPDCKSTADYSFNSRLYGTVNLCSYHKTKVEELVSPKLSVDAALKTLLQTAISDLEKACKLKPDFTQAKENLKLANNFRSNLA